MNPEEMGEVSCTDFLSLEGPQVLWSQVWENSVPLRENVVFIYYYYYFGLAFQGREFEVWVL